MTVALEAPPASLESMLTAARKEPGPEGKLHVAILKSLPGHDGYDLAGAKSMLGDLGDRYPDSEIGAVAHERLAELWQENACWKQTSTLQLKLHQMVDIERSIDGQPK